MRVRLMRLQLRVRMLRANFNLRWDLLTVGFGRRSLPPDKYDAVGEAGQPQYRGRLSAEAGFVEGVTSRRR